MHPKSIAVREELIKVARDRGTITYGELAARLKLGIARGTASYLDEVGEFEIANGRPLLTAVVVSKEKQMSGEGFFNLSRQLQLYDGSDDHSFWEVELKKVHDSWARRS